jgi:hypothetical protein
MEESTQAAFAIGQRLCLLNLLKYNAVRPADEFLFDNHSSLGLVVYDAYFSDMARQLGQPFTDGMLMTLREQTGIFVCDMSYFEYVVFACDRRPFTQTYFFPAHEQTNRNIRRRRADKDQPYGVSDEEDSANTQA